MVSVGRIVHYSDELTDCNAALVTAVSRTSYGQVTLAVFPASAPGEAMADVPHSATAGHVGTWHWPEGSQEHQALIVNPPHIF
jgi:hypothetical protein